MTTTETTPVTAIEVRRPRIKVLVAAFGFGLIVAAASAAAILVAYDQSHNGRVFHGVTVGTVDLSDLDRDTAAARLSEAYASYGQGAVTLESGDIRRTITYDKLGRGPDVDGLLDQAFAVGRTGTVVDRALDEVRTAFRPVTIQPLATIDPAISQRPTRGPSRRRTVSRAPRRCAVAPSTRLRQRPRSSRLSAIRPPRPA
ncbi:MAG: hypothetical protein E6I94_04440 [Chloroflexi bacterium]|nr:MAG: hypothetical protein E6I94_04440 [Chloroflexota bacterium]